MSLPVHTLVFRADCGSKKAASSNIETTFSGAADLLSDFHAGSMAPETLSMYMRISENWKYTWLRPAHDEIWAAYIDTWGMEAAAAATAAAEEEDNAAETGDDADDTDDDATPPVDDDAEGVGDVEGM